MQVEGLARLDGELGAAAVPQGQAVRALRGERQAVNALGDAPMSLIYTDQAVTELIQNVIVSAALLCRSHPLHTQNCPTKTNRTQI